MKALVERLKGRPFTIVGINSDYKGDLEKINAMLKEQGITWPQVIDGTTSGPVATKWNVRGWPTIYVLDANGVIRFRDSRGAELGKAVDELMKETGEKKTY